MSEQETYVLVFNSTHAALAVRAWVLDAAQRERFGDVAVIATPEAIQAGCGMSLLFSQVNGERRHALAQLGTQFEHCDMRLFRRTVSSCHDATQSHGAAGSNGASTSHDVASSNGTINHDAVPSHCSSLHSYTSTNSDVATNSDASTGAHASTSPYTYQACEFSSFA